VAVNRQVVTLKQALEARPFLTERHLRRLVAERRMPFYKLGGKLLFDLDEIDNLVDACRFEAR
jgi:excisionase family DNA binding protein